MKVLCKIIFVMTLVACGNGKNNVSPSEINVKKCVIIEQDFEVVNLSANEYEQSNIELKSFNASNFQYDVLYHHSVEGTDEYFFGRWYLDYNGKWFHVQIKDNVRSIRNIICDEEASRLFSSVAFGSYIQKCDDCFLSKNYTFLIKNGQERTSITSNGTIFKNLEISDSLKIEHYNSILNFFLSR